MDAHCRHFGLLAVERGSELKHLFKGFQYIPAVGLGDITGLWVSTLFFIAMILVGPMLIERERQVQTFRENQQNIDALNKNLGRVVDEKVALQTTVSELQNSAVELKQDISELQETADQFTKAFEGSPLGMIMVRGEGGIWLANQAIGDALIYTREVFIGKTLADFVDPRDEAILRSDANPAEVRFLRSDGYFIWTLLNRSNLQTGKDGIEYTIYQIQDITERKLAEDSIVENEQTLRGLLDATHDIALLLDRELKVITANENFCNRAGLTLDELIGNDPFESFGEPSASRRRDFVRQAVESKEAKRFEDQRAGHWFESNYYPILDDSGEVLQIAAFARDISDRKRMEGQLRRETKIQELITAMAVQTATATSASEAFRLAIDEICKRTGWQVGHVYTLDPNDREKLVSSGIWRTDDEKRYKGVVAYTEANPVTAGVGNAGKVFEKAKSMWTHIVNAKSPKARGKVLYRTGLRCAIIAPVIAGNKVHAVLEFMTSMRLKRDPLMLDALTQMGVQLGRVIEREAAEAALRESESRFRDFAAATADRFWQTDQDFNIETISTPPNSLYTSSDKMVGHPFWDIDEIKFDEEARNELIALFESREPFKNVPFVYDSEQGKRRVVAYSGIPVFDGNGEFQGYRGTSTDETERQAAHQRAENIQQTFTDSMEHLPAGFIMWDSEDRFMTCNSHYREIQKETLGYLEDGILFKDYISRLADSGLILEAVEDKQGWLERQYEMHREPFSEHQVHTKDGLWLRIRKQRLPDGSMIAFHFDITDLQQAEDALRRSEERFRDFANAGADWFYEQDADLRYTFVSDSVTDVIGLTWEDFIGKTRTELFELDGIFIDPDVLKDHEKIIEAHQPFDYLEYAIEISGQPRRYAQINGHPIFDENGKFAGYRGTARDITMQRDAESIQSMARQDAELASRSKSEFLANMSHELRTPLNAIIGFSDTLVQQVFGPMSNAKQIEYVEHIRDSGQHLLNLINDVLDVSAIEFGKLDLQQEPVDLKAVAEAAVMMLKTRANEDKIHLVNLLEFDVPVILADETRLKQVFVNLLSNAVKFSEAGGVVTIGMENDITDNLTIFVRDTGIGMNSVDLAQALETFGRVQSSDSAHREGTGLGLPLTQALVEAHGGDLNIDSSPGAGTVVRLIFPADLIVPE